MRGTRTDSTVLDLTWLDDQLSRRPPASVAVLDIDSTIMDTASETSFFGSAVSPSSAAASERS